MIIDTADGHSDLLKKLKDGDRPACLRLAHEWTTAGMDDETFFKAHILSALRELGVLWERNAINIAEEHQATDILRQMVSVRAFLDPPKSADKGTAIVGCVPDELHDLPALILANLLERNGWRVRFFGASAPSQDILELAVKTRPDLACFAVKTLPRLWDAADLFQELRTLSPHTRIMVGGLDAPEFRAALQALVDAFVDCPVSAVQIADGFTSKTVR